MNIPGIINLSILHFPVHYLIYTLVGLAALFLIWREAVKDGFDRERVLDLYFISLVLLGVFYYLLKYYSFYDYFVEKNFGLLLVTLFGGSTLLIYRHMTSKWKWSFYRFLDIFSLVYFILAVAAFYFKVGGFQEPRGYILLGVFITAYLLVFAFRNRILSGAVFSIFLLLVAIFGQLFYQQKQHLIFYFSLITISMVNLVFRSKRSMVQKKLGFDFIARVRGMLLSKDKRLKSEQQKLTEEDPYLKEGRTMDNAEEMDEAILEDRAKVEIDIKKQSIESMQDQVKKALGKMEKGEYGVCETCGQQIDKARLEVYPEATKCLECAREESAQS